LIFSAWTAVCLALAWGAALAFALPTAWLDWQPARVAEIWRWWSAAWVHWSVQHLLANLAGTVVLAALGWAARLPRHAALAWLLAWPLTQLGLLAKPELLHFGGLSGVLHAGVAVAVVLLVLRRDRRDRLWGLLIGLGLIAKLVLEQPFGPALRSVAGWDIAIAPLAHATGALAGSLCALLVHAARPQRARS
jgi:rhomboid family GlyGly-CTERM serine protease